MTEIQRNGGQGSSGCISYIVANFCNIAKYLHNSRVGFFCFTESQNVRGWKGHLFQW